MLSPAMNRIIGKRREMPSTSRDRRVYMRMIYGKRCIFGIKRDGTITVWCNGHIIHRINLRGN